jgi:hypothetical protein
MRGAITFEIIPSDMSVLQNPVRLVFRALVRQLETIPTDPLN